MQVDPIKPALKPPGIELLNLKCDEPLSKFAFNFKLRRHLKERTRLAKEAGAYTRPLFGST